MKNHKYCVYLTIYSGTKLPPFYVGSSSIQQIKNGYNGSIRSKKYKDIYKQEQKENKHLFKTIIIRTSITRSMALAMERFIHIKDNVVKSDLFFNMALATKNGFFGMDNSGANHPLYGIKRSKEERVLISKNHADVSGRNNPMSKIIHIFDKNSKKVLETKGNFKKICLENNLPFTKLKHSYQRDGETLYINLKERYRHTIKKRI